MERHLREVYPDLELCVLGIPDPAGLVGNIPVLAYTGEEEMDLTIGAVGEELAGNLERTKLPRALLRVPELPKTTNGKVKRGELRDIVVSLLSEQPVS